MSTIKNLIFDLDNTLYDFSTIWKESNKLVYKYLKYVNVNIKMYKSDKIKMYNYSKLT